jgi:hypothetical protein
MTVSFSKVAFDDFQAWAAADKSKRQISPTASLNSLAAEPSIKEIGLGAGLQNSGIESSEILASSTIRSWKRVVSRFQGSNSASLSAGVTGSMVRM